MLEMLFYFEMLLILISRSRKFFGSLDLYQFPVLIHLFSNQLSKGQQKILNGVQVNRESEKVEDVPIKIYRNEKPFLVLVYLIL